MALFRRTYTEKKTGKWREYAIWCGEFSYVGKR
jgi:hypothetical protein